MANNSCHPFLIMFRMNFNASQYDNTLFSKSEMTTTINVSIKVCSEVLVPFFRYFDKTSLCSKYLPRKYSNEVHLFKPEYVKPTLQVYFHNISNLTAVKPLSCSGSWSIRILFE